MDVLFTSSLSLNVHGHLTDVYCMYRSWTDNGYSILYINWTYILCTKTICMDTITNFLNYHFLQSLSEKLSTNWWTYLYIKWMSNSKHPEESKSRTWVWNWLHPDFCKEIQLVMKLVFTTYSVDKQKRALPVNPRRPWMSVSGPYNVRRPGQEMDNSKKHS